MLDQLERVGKRLEIARMARILWEWMDMAGNGWNGLKWLEMAGNGCISRNWIENSENCWKWLVQSVAVFVQPSALHLADD